jgi:hypothetical protein
VNSEERPDRLIEAVAKMAVLPDSEKVDIRGKRYAEVHTRVQAFREAYGENGKIISTIHLADDTKVLAETSVSVFVDGTWRLIANDFAEEFRASGPVNKTSAVENCLTSSIGRALSACGLSGGNYASFDEVHHAINDKAKAPEPKPKKPPTATAKPKPPSSLETRMAKQKELVAGATPENIKNVMDFIFLTIFHFALPPEGTEQKEGAPETVAGWIDQFTSSNGNKKTLVELYNAGFKEEVEALNKRLDKIRVLEIKELYQLLREQKEK